MSQNVDFSLATCQLLRETLQKEALIVNYENYLNIKLYINAFSQYSN